MERRAKTLLDCQLLLDAIISCRKCIVLPRVGFEALKIWIVVEGSFCDGIQNLITTRPRSQRPGPLRRLG